MEGICIVLTLENENSICNRTVIRIACSVCVCVSVFVIECDCF